MNISLRKGRHGCSALLLIASVTLTCGSRAVAQDSPVASFEVRAPGNQPVAANGSVTGAGAKAKEPALSFSFRFASWESVLVKFADVAGLTLDLTEVPPGTFNYHDNGRYSPREALDVLNGYLLQRGFVLVRRDRFLVCVNIAKGIPANLIPTVTVDQLADYGNNELVSVILSHEALDAGLAVGQIEQLQGPQGNVVSLNATNSLLVTDTGGNVRLIHRLLEKGAFSRRPTADTGTGFKSFALQHVRAEDAERLIRTLFGLPPATSSTKDAAAGAPRAADLSITTDARTNRLFVTATNGQLTSIEQIVAAYDVADAAADHPTQRGATVTRIVPLPNADVITIGRALESLSPRIRVSTTRGIRAAATAGSRSTDSPDEPATGTRSRVETPQSATPSRATPQTPTPQTPTTPNPDGRH